MTVTPEQIAEWKRLADAATEGPWEGDGFRFISAMGAVDTYSGSVWASIIEVYNIERNDSFGRNWSSSGTAAANAAFIVASRSAVPALITEIERLTAERDALKERRDLYDASAQMADDGDIVMTAAERVLAWLLIEVVRVPDDVGYSPNQAQVILTAAIRKALEASK